MQLIIEQLAKQSPFILLFILLLYFVLEQSYISIYLFIAYILVIISNFIAKYIIFKPIFDILNVTTLPILGLGIRPESSYKNKNSDFIIDKLVLNSFGMPSGHSQIMWALATYIIYKYLNYVSIYTILGSIIIIAIASYVSYSRVYIEKCHTIQQVIVGSILGIISGIIVYYYEDKFIKLLKNFVK
jgi:membrane-associated phospholipid phosphatase